MINFGCSWIDSVITILLCVKYSLSTSHVPVFNHNTQYYKDKEL